MIHLFSPERIIMGGGVSHAFGLRIDDIHAVICATQSSPLKTCRLYAPAWGRIRVSSVLRPSSVTLSIVGPRGFACHAFVKRFAEPAPEFDTFVRNDWLSVRKEALVSL